MVTINANERSGLGYSEYIYIYIYIYNALILTSELAVQTAGLEWI